MKRIIPAILLIAFLLFLCSCRKKEITVSTQEEATSKSVETVTIDDITLNYSAIDEKDDTTSTTQSSAQTSSQNQTTTFTSNKSDSTSTKASTHPFDQDGDGYIDGWY